ncbi:hypothetical protein GCM10025868_24640 [Angustibacter aerolatus]|uniref:Alkyl hydroperoxide reductase subunit C/ Thiol specific antioxidant domain-containing protein n=1 Tax=Angustibacter aerolatus TaxID=1162965 RepID=A0ABQ6JJB7_9ACTN|nr:hypothetical protein GCM10025868_24640 [Angustibacter aerolatus]
MLVTVGVHSPKFEHEADADALVAAVERYDVHHPVLDDPELGTWSAYAARAWPTLAVVDPEGYVVAQAQRRGARARAAGAARRAWSPSTRRRARCTAATARTYRRGRRRPRCASPARRSRCPGAPCW